MRGENNSRNMPKQSRLRDIDDDTGAMSKLQGAVAN
jgi:hypothetical protein